MMIGRLALALVLAGSALALAGCGRLGFREVAASDAADGATEDAVTVIVVSDQYLSEPAGKPIAGATVLVDRATGRDRLMTDAAGIVRFSAAGALTCHVVYKSDLGWRGYTVDLSLAGAPGATEAPPGTTIELGGRPAANPNHNITFALPPNATADSFTVRVPQHCAFPPLSSSPSVSTAFDAACEGASVHALGFGIPAVGSSASPLYLDAGMVTLADHATRMVTGEYHPLAVRMLSVTNLPAATDSVSAEILQRAGLDLTALMPTPVSATSGATASLQLATAPGGNALSIRVFSATPVAYLSSSERLAPLNLATATTFDARDVLPLVGSLAVRDAARVGWTGGEGGTIAIVERNAGGVQWDWYLPASSTAAKLPDIPADLGVPGPKPADYAQITKLAVPGATAADLVRTIDRRWPQWPHDELLLPQAGGSMARMFYSATLGPP
jgi:hypothetical protein